MYLCSNGHEEIVIETPTCPLCEKIGECEDLEKEIEDLKNEIDNLEGELINARQ